MPIVGGLDIHRKQLTFDYLDTVTGEVKRGQIAPADRAHLRAWLTRFADRDDAAFALEGCTGWRYVAEELAFAGIAAHVASRLTPPSPAAVSGTPRRTRPTHGTSGSCWPRAGAECWIPRHASWNAGRCWRPTTICGPSTPPGCSASTRCSSTRAPRPWARPRCVPAATCRRCMRRPQRSPRPGRCRWLTALDVLATLEAQLDMLRHRLLDDARHLTGAKVLAERLYGVGPATALAITCWLGGAGRFSSSRKAVGFAGLDITVYSSDSKRSPGRLSRQGPPVLRWALYRRARPTPAPPPPTTATTRRSRTARTASAPPSPRPARSSARPATS